MPSPPTNPPKSLSDAARSFAVEQAIATGIAVVDGSGQQTHVNDAFCRMVGCAREELVGARPPFSYWPEESVGEIEAALQLALAGRFPREGLTLTFRRRSGERFPVLLLLTPFIGEGASGCWQATVVDLAVAAAQLKALERSEQLLRTAQEAAHVGVWAFDLATGETWRSPECERLSGLVPGSHPSHEQWLQRVHPDDRHLLDFQHAVPPRAGESFEVEFRIRLDTGEERWLLSRGQMYCDAGGQPARFVGTNLDITERKRTAAELDQYRRELDRRVAESTGLLAERSAQLVRTHFAMDRAGIGIAWNDVSGRFLYVNDEACRQLGYSRDELLQLTVSDVNPQMTPDDFRELAAQMREHGRRFNDQAVHRRKDGSTYPVEVTAYLERADGREQFIAFYNDLTERVRLEQELRASEQRWKFALEATAQGVWDRDIPADKIDYTPRYAEMLGCAVSELGQSIAEVYGSFQATCRICGLTAVRFAI